MPSADLAAFVQDKVFTVEIAPTASLADLRQMVASVASVSAAEISLKSGFPPKPIIPADNEAMTVASSGLQNRDTLILSNDMATIPGPGKRSGRLKAESKATKRKWGEGVVLGSQSDDAPAVVTTNTAKPSSASKPSKRKKAAWGSGQVLGTGE